MTGESEEFALIARHFVPLAHAPAARGLLDDAAVLDHHGTLVVTTDAIVEGVHFLPDDPIDLVAQKALRVNLSDLAAKGAAPLHYLLALQWPTGRPVDQIADFAAGLARDQATYGCTLIGGDTTSTPGPLAIVITAFGRPIAGRAPARDGAQAGDDVWVTGTIGDGVLGLAARKGALGGLHPEQLAFLISRYQTPSPRTAFAAAVSRFAHASMDVSDGLLGDAAIIAGASGVAIKLAPETLPLSQAAAAWLAEQDDCSKGLGRLATGGDDYELLFTAAASSRAALREAADDIGLRLTLIGSVDAGSGVDAGDLPVASFVHRLGPSTNR